MTPPETPFVSVIVPVFNDRERLGRCLERLDRQTYPAERFEILVVDNDSDEPQAAEHPGPPPVRVVMELRRGSDAARNLGLELARGEIVAFVDADCLPAPDWLAKGVETLAGLVEIGMVGGRIEVFAQESEEPTWVELLELGAGFPQRTYVEGQHYAATANLFAHRELFRRVGEFDSRLEYYGDYEWGQRVHAAGFSQLYGEDAVVRHPARRTVAELRAKARGTASGAHQLATREPRTPWTAISAWLRGLMPPRHLLLLIWASPRLGGLGERLAASLVAVMRKGFATCEWIRLDLRTLLRRGP